MPCIKAYTCTHAQVGTPVGLVVEDEAQIHEAQRAYECPTTNVHDPEQPQVQVLTWQSHLKGSRKGGSCGSCMG